MAVLTVAREFGSIVSGEELALCNSLNLHCVSKTTLEQRFAALGIEKEFLSRSGKATTTGKNSAHITMEKAGAIRIITIW